VWYFTNRELTTDSTIPTTADTIGLPSGGAIVGDSSGGVTKLPGTVASYDPNPPSDSPVVDNKDSKVVTEELFELSDDPSLYLVFYDEPSGSFTITLYGEDTGKARTAAEAFILKKLTYTKEQWCSFPVTVMTNEYENPTWSGINVGLSFCPGAIKL
jgi:hypothetical protein